MVLKKKKKKIGWVEETELLQSNGLQIRTGGLLQSQVKSPVMNPGQSGRGGTAPRFVEIDL
jgi:hypothetical protein